MVVGSGSVSDASTDLGRLSKRSSASVPRQNRPASLWKRRLQAARRPSSSDERSRAIAFCRLSPGRVFHECHNPGRTNRSKLHPPDCWSGFDREWLLGVNALERIVRIIAVGGILLYTCDFQCAVWCRLLLAACRNGIVSQTLPFR